MGKSSKKNRKSSAAASHGEDGNRKEDEEDRRFDTSRPQFRKPKQQERKVVLDERFASVLTDERFQVKVQDRRGRPSKGKKERDGTAEDMSAFYTVEGETADGEGNVAGGVKAAREATVAQGKGSRRRKDEEASDSDAESEREGPHQFENQPASRIAYLTALSRGQIDVSSSSSSDDGGDNSSDDEKARARRGEHGGSGESSDSEEESKHRQSDEESVPGVLDPSSKRDDDAATGITHDPTPVLAVLNLDWSHVRAVDVFALLSSFAPPGALKRVRVFVSDFGKQKLAEEERLGPSGIWKEDGKKDGRSKPGDGSGGEDDEQVDGDGDGDGDGENDNSREGSEGSSDEESGESDDDSVEEDTLGEEDDDIERYLPESDHVDSGFDREKLRAYEAAKLRYYFAVAEFASAAHADAAYREVDGMEFEHSSAAVDLRAIPPEGLGDVVRDRELRDEARGLPSNYVPPDFVVGALQQSNLQCTWEAGDRDRERTLTKYGSGAAWQSLAESDDLKAYLASDASSDGDNGSDNEKATNMRRMLGLDSDQEDDTQLQVISQPAKQASPVPSSASEPGSSSEAESDDDEGNEEMSKEVTFVPGQKKDSLESKIRSKLSSRPENEELTPWQKYQQKRKEKRRERRLAARAKRESAKDSRSGRSQRADGDGSDDDDSDDGSSTGRIQTREELELLLAGEENDETARDFDMRGLERLEKLKGKKLRGSRKRRESERASNVTGAEFKLDLSDDRFKAVLEGDDDRFGIDRTDPSYRETPAMKEILSEQARRRKSKKRRRDKDDSAVAPNVVAEASASNGSSGAAALSALVTRIKSKVNT